MHRLIFCSLLLLLGACKKEVKPAFDVQSQELRTNHPISVEKIEQAHKKNKFLQNQTICTNLLLDFGGNTSKLKLLTATNSSNIRLEKADGTITIVKDGTLYTNADSTEWENEKFSIYTWQYFLMAPYKLSDAGTHWAKLPPVVLRHDTLNAGLLTFDDGVGDSPDDWYRVYSQPQSHIISDIAYIVTAGDRQIEEAEKDARIIHYDHYVNVEGIPMATKWEFYTYTIDKGIGKTYGSATLQNLLFMDDLEETYDISDLFKVN